MIDFNWSLLEDKLNEKLGIAYWAKNKKQLVTYCPWCEPESTKSHGHLYLYNNSDNIPTIWCFKCGDEGKGRGTILKFLKFIGEDVSSYISKELFEKYKNADKNYNYTKKNIRKQTKHRTPVVNTDAYKLKTMYLKSRLGFDYDISKIPNLVFDIRNFLYDNKIDIGTKDRFLDYYENSFIGFVTNRGTTLYLRNIDHNSDLKHDKIPLVDSTDDMYRDYYGVRLLNPLSEDTNNIVLCEGIFDLLVGIETHELNELRKKSCMWAASLGCYYSSLIPSLLSDCMITVANFVILSDNNKKEENYKWFGYNPSVMNFEIIWNKLGDDFGCHPILPISKTFKRNRRYKI